jgi:hypothetical protein
MNHPIEIFWIGNFCSVEMSLTHKFSSFREFKKYKDQLNSSDEIVKQSVSSEEGPKMKLSKFKSHEDLRTDSSFETSSSLKISKKYKSTTSLRELKPQKILTYDEQQKEKKQAKLLIFLDKHELPEPITLDSLLETLSETWEEDQDDVIWS